LNSMLAHGGSPPYPYGYLLLTNKAGSVSEVFCHFFLREWLGRIAKT
jgi:hypothetical protein